MTVVELAASAWQSFKTPWLFLLCIASYILLTPIYRLTLHPLSSYPGPRLWCMTRIPWFISLHSGNLHCRIHDFHEKYGPVVRIAPNELSYTHPDAWKDIYGNKSVGRNSVWFTMPKSDPASIMGSDEIAHARLRRAFIGAFGETNMKDINETVHIYAKAMVDRLSKVTDSDTRNELVDLVDWLEFTTFDMSGDLSFGASFGSIERAQGHPWVKISGEFGKMLSIIATMNLMWPLGKVLMAMKPNMKLGNFDPDLVPNNVGGKFIYHRGLAKLRVQQRLASKAQKSDFISSVEKYNREMLEKRHGDKVVTTGEIESNMSVFVFAGSETTSSALSGVLRYVMKDDGVMTRLQQEIRGAFDNMEDISVAAVSKLEYLTAVINEGLRLAPPVVIGIPRQTPKEGSFVCDKYVPGDTLVTINQYAANRTSYNFADATSFRPDRFLPAQNSLKDNLEIFQPFLTGRHHCIGYKLAWTMMRIILAELVFSFDMTLASPDEVLDFGQQKTFIFWKKEPLMVRLRQRHLSH